MSGTPSPCPSQEVSRHLHDISHLFRTRLRFLRDKIALATKWYVNWYAHPFNLSSDSNHIQSILQDLLRKRDGNGDETDKKSRNNQKEKNHNADSAILRFFISIFSW